MSPDGLPVMDGMGGMWIKLTVCGVTRLGYGHAGDKTGGDAIKEVIGDALRNAAMRFGAALDLWHKGDLHVEYEQRAPRGSGAEANADAFNGLQPEIQDALRRVAKNVTDAMPNASKARDILLMGLEEWSDQDPAELHKAIWHLLDSKTRTAIKLAGKAA